MQQIAVARLHVDERKPGLARDAGSPHEMGDQLLQLAIGPYDRVVMGIDAKPGVEQWMMIGNSRFEPRRVRPAEAARVCQLQADKKIVDRSMPLSMRPGRGVDQGGKPRAILGRGQRLSRIGPPRRFDRRGFAPPDQLGSAGAEMSPPPQH